MVASDGSCGGGAGSRSCARATVATRTAARAVANRILRFTMQSCLVRGTGDGSIVLAPLLRLRRRALRLLVGEGDALVVVYSADPAVDVREHGKPGQCGFAGLLVHDPDGHGGGWRDAGAGQQAHFRLLVLQRVDGSRFGVEQN